MRKPLSGKIALVAGATRGAGRGIACGLGELGATVYCSGRSTRGDLVSGRPETIEETAELVTARGGEGRWAKTDHTDPAQVEALCARIQREQGGLDILVNDVWGGERLIEIGVPFWRSSADRVGTLLHQALASHLITARYAAPLLFGRPNPLIVEVTDGDTFGYRGSLAYDLVKMGVIRLAFGMAWELRRHKVTALAVTPGFLRSEEMLALFGVTEANWREGAEKDPNFLASETPFFVGRAVAALAADPQVSAKNGRVFSSWTLAHEYDLYDLDGSRPDWGAHFSRTYGRTPRPADEAAYDSWREGPIEIAFPDWPIEGGQ